MNYEITIGLEVHAELLTESKLFCGCSTDFGKAANTQTCPVCLGLPGVLPVINKKAVEYALLTAIALNCRINSFCRFARKNYYYPDLPKNYQISQYDEPLSNDGYLEINLKGKAKKIEIERVHLEEDAGKLIHGEETKYSEDKEVSFVDYNRAGIPLMEIVSKPDIHSPEEAYQYLVTLKRILKYLEVSDCNMEEGSLRCDANISLAPKGEKMGTKIELKNMNSFKEVKDGLTAEVKRQSQILDKGEKITQETRLWDSKRKKTNIMRSKEEAYDYRYFPEPDLLPLNIDKEWIESLKSRLPEMPKERYQRFIREYNLPEYDAGVLTDSKELADYFEECIKIFSYPKIVSNWIMGEFLYLLNKEKKSIKEVKVAPYQTAELLDQFKKGIISGKLAKKIFEKMFKTGRGAKEIIEKEGLIQISDEQEVGKIVDKVISENLKAVDDFKKGKNKALGFLVGEIMKKTKGKANPQIVNKLLKNKIRGEK
ncbi:Asp-tRNA(Asn)/Glu-tRNA(Gln) amidotransferase subunit GatB [Candidatus Aerophobetes bacterium]|nr:Asp-tRNA(Asn)/Glu-tRNA(Gln) amidotransferase subunit GatB [Candidatus Aerophobetes bacterium]